MGYRAKQNVFSWGTPNGLQTSEEVLYILSHQGIANQNNPEIPPHTSQIGQDPKLRWQQMLVRLRRKRNTSPLLVGLQANTTTLEICLAIPQKIGYSTTWRPSYSTSEHIPQRHFNTQQRYMHTMFIAALFIIARSWKEPRCPSVDEWIQELWYIYTMEYYSAIRNNDFTKFLRKWLHL